MASSLPSHMKASQWTTTSGGIEKTLKYTTSAKLPKNANSLPAKSTLVKVSHASINPVDYKLAELPIINRFFTRPASPGLDYAGTVVATTLPHLKPGDRVFGKSQPLAFGSTAEYLVISGEDGCVALPDEVSFEQAACVGVAGLTAYESIAPFVEPGNKVLINGGSGGVGTFGIQIAKHLGCSVTVSCSGKNADFCKELGADEVIDYRSTPVVEALKRSGTQYDLIVDNVFAEPQLYWQSHHYLKPSGRFVTVTSQFTAHSIASLTGILTLPKWLGGGSRKAQFLGVGTKKDEFETIARLMKEGKVKAQIEEVFPLEKLGEAFARLKAGRVRGKLVIQI
ncbi:zinc alcohol dehydrogenase like protein [Zymoseptoria brevis]|uniref:Zinc alcohol dehydrogenase like protein n=1 Tax=Zymoseptoria brevis TaxID=1047168 RepID=A0A0F4G6U0_9PEZI|nr:zinc alcohol dehydrogenase like protein [Zymoseptoria brevis]